MSYIDFALTFLAEVMMDIAKINPYIRVAMQSVLPTGMKMHAKGAGAAER